MDFTNQIDIIFDLARYQMNHILPSTWAEDNRILRSHESSMPGPLRFDKTPYHREILDCLKSDHPARKVAIQKGAQIGFALWIKTLIATLNGFKTMGELKIGDFVFDEKGKLCKVIKTTDFMYGHDCYDVYFSDGSIIKADANHLWAVDDLDLEKQVINTKNIYNNFFKGYFITNKKPYSEKYITRLIIKVMKCDSVPVKCITVDSHNNLFLAGATCIATHNSTVVLENGIGYIIAEQPGNILFLAGSQKLVKESVDVKIDGMIDTCGIRHLIRPNSLRKRNGRSGDTSESKEFPRGVLYTGAGSHSNLRQRSVRYIFIDDFDNFDSGSLDSGSTTSMIEQRAASYYDDMKIFYISTPELKHNSNIEPVFNKGDQRYFNIHCPNCYCTIDYRWEIRIDDKEKAGMIWKLDNLGHVIEGSVEYVCQKCGGAFDDSRKLERNQDGIWIPTAKPFEPGYYSYHINALYSPPKTKNWEAYARDYMEAYPKNKPVNNPKAHTFRNLCLGLTWEEVGEEPKSNQIMLNTRNYSVETVPYDLSMDDGNGEIVLITIAADLGGFVEDARLDYEVVAWAKSGVSYSICHGSIGTFVNNNKTSIDRQKWNYKNETENFSVWAEFRNVVDQEYPILSIKGGTAKATMCCIDSGYFTEYAFSFIDKQDLGIVCIGIKGRGKEQFSKINSVSRVYRKSSRRANLYSLDGNYIKDDLSSYMRLEWKEGTGTKQNSNFMNFPTPERGLYDYKNFFSHYEAEHKIMIKDKFGNDNEMSWVKKSGHQNHFFDCRCYNMAAKEIFQDLICIQFGYRNPNWKTFCEIMLDEI